MHLGFGNWGQKLYLFEHDLVLFNYNRMYYFLTFRLNPLTFDDISTELQSAECGIILNLIFISYNIYFM